MWSISCNIQHLAQQQCQHKIQWSMLRRRTLRHFRQANMATWQSNPHDDVIKLMKASVASRRKQSEHWEHCAAYDQKRSFRRRNEGKPTVYAMKQKRNGSRIMWIERLQWQESEFKMRRMRLCKSRNIWGMSKRHDRQPQSLKQHLRICWMLSEIVWAILQVPKMRRMGKTRMMVRTIQSFASQAKTMNLAGWWAQSPKWYRTAWRAFSRSRWGLTNWRNRDGGTQPTTSVREIWSMGRLNWRFWLLWIPKQTWQQPHHHRQHLDSLRRFLISSLHNSKYRKLGLDREVVKWSLVLRNLRQTITYYHSCPTRSPIRHRGRLRRQFNPWAFTPAYSIAS